MFAREAVDMFEDVEVVGEDDSPASIAPPPLMKRRKSYSLLPSLEVPNMSYSRGSILPVIDEDWTFMES